MVPKHIDTLVVIAPPLLRTIPWSLLLVEYPNDEAKTHLNSMTTREIGRFLGFQNLRIEELKN